METTTLKARTESEREADEETGSVGPAGSPASAESSGAHGQPAPETRPDGVSGVGAPLPARLAFLVYLNRSGSTFLARLLADYQDVAVSLEAQFDDGLVRAGWRVRDEADLDRLLDRILADPKFPAWNVNPARLRRRLRDGGFPIPFPRFLRTALAETFDGDPAQVHVYKNGRMLERPDAFRAAFPGTKVVFILRDPRAIHASQGRSRDSRTERRMSTSPVQTARWFVRTVRTLQRFAGADWLHVLRFEDLMSDPDGECERVLGFLGVSARRRQSAGSYSERIPESQRHLHGNVARSADPQRSVSWGDELDESEVVLIEAIAGSDMERFGYAPSRPALTAGQRIAAFVGRIAGECSWALARARWSLLTRPRLGNGRADEPLRARNR